MEVNLWRWMKAHADTVPGALHLQRVENRSSSHPPDVEGAIRLDHASPGFSFWVELKSTARPKRVGSKLRFPVRGRERQRAWIQARTHLAPVFILCQVGTGAALTRYLLGGAHAARLYEGGETENFLQENDVWRGARGDTAEAMFRTIWNTNMTLVLNRLPQQA